MPAPLKPPALRPGDAVRILSLASPVDESRVDAGCKELARLGYVPKLDREQVLARDSFFAGSAADRGKALAKALAEPETRAIVCARGGYGSNYLIEGLQPPPDTAKNSSRLQRRHVPSGFSLAEIRLGNVLRPDGRLRLRPRRKRAERIRQR